MVFIFPPVIQAALCQGYAAKTSCKHGGFSGMVKRALFFWNRAFTNGLHSNNLQYTS
jgi:hypothetical protein